MVVLWLSSSIVIAGAGWGGNFAFPVSFPQCPLFPFSRVSSLCLHCALWFYFFCCGWKSFHAWGWFLLLSFPLKAQRHDGWVVGSGYGVGWWVGLLKLFVCLCFAELGGNWFVALFFFCLLLACWIACVTTLLFSRTNTAEIKSSICASAGSE
ncbi:hypothetical protein BDV95DRAFT_362506 [Massariosphaeria phaeospora]|uniref:Uncharacterized protein n=1 Tax=Massariosphaeria phaeospora TaxID=100035 RepID=A0A7C8MC67_9PLEO|nr:hypothetical protein BDV95DRAFT_362506 [Massariosphaeria phaeospora]